MQLHRAVERVRDSVALSHIEDVMAATRRREDDVFKSVSRFVSSDSVHTNMKIGTLAIGTLVQLEALIVTAAVSKFPYTNHTVSDRLHGPHGRHLSVSLVSAGIMSAASTYSYRGSIPPLKILSREFGAEANKEWTRVITSLLVVGEAGLSFAGGFDSDSKVLHFGFGAIPYLVVTPTAIIALGLDMMENDEKLKGFICVAGGTIALASSIAGIANHKKVTALHELLTSLGVIVPTVTLSSGELVRLVRDAHKTSASTMQEAA